MTCEAIETFDLAFWIDRSAAAASSTGQLAQEDDEVLVPLGELNWPRLNEFVLDEFDIADPFVLGGLVGVTSTGVIGIRSTTTLGFLNEWPAQPEDRRQIWVANASKVEIRLESNSVVIEELWAPRRCGVISAVDYSTHVRRVHRTLSDWRQVILQYAMGRDRQKASAIARCIPDIS